MKSGAEQGMEGRMKAHGRVFKCRLCCTKQNVLFASLERFTAHVCIKHDYFPSFCSTCHAHFPAISFGRRHAVRTKNTHNVIYLDNKEEKLKQEIQVSLTGTAAKTVSSAECVDLEAENSPAEVAEAGHDKQEHQQNEVGPPNSCIDDAKKTGHIIEHETKKPEEKGSLPVPDELETVERVDFDAHNAEGNKANCEAAPQAELKGSIDTEAENAAGTEEAGYDSGHQPTTPVHLGESKTFGAATNRSPPPERRIKLYRQKNRRFSPERSMDEATMTKLSKLRDSGHVDYVNSLLGGHGHNEDEEESLKVANGGQSTPPPFLAGKTKRYCRSEKPPKKSALSNTDSDETPQKSQTAVKVKVKAARLCLLCDAVVVAKSGLKRHILQKHTANKPFGCSLCSYRTKRKAEAVKHVNSGGHALVGVRIVDDSSLMEEEIRELMMRCFTL